MPFFKKTLITQIFPKTLEMTNQLSYFKIYKVLL